MAASDIIIEVNGKPTDNSAGGFLDTITDLKFGNIAYIQISVNGTNVAHSLTPPSASKATVTILGPKKIIYQKEATSSSHSPGTNWYVWYRTQTVLLRPGPPPVYGPYGYNTLVDDLAGNLPPGNQPSPTYGGPNMLGGQYFSTYADALAYSAYLNGLWTAFAVSEVGSTSNPSSSTTYTGDWLLKVTAATKSLFPLAIRGISGVSGSGFNANISMFTTGNPIGTKNITGAQATKIKKPADFAPLGISLDNISSAGGVGNGAYTFTCWRASVKPPHLLYEGVHIKGTSPFPSV